MDRMRAEDRCFNCKETGHQSSNCPEKHQAKPPKQKISVGAARYDYLNSLGMNDLATEKAEASIHSDSVHAGSEELIDPPTREPGADQVWLQAPAAEVCAYIKKLWMSAYPPDEAISEGMIPDERFTVIEYGSGFEVTDWLQCQVPYMVTREDLTRLRLQNRGCFVGDEPDHEYPALNWLLLRFGGALTDLDNVDMDTAVERLIVDPATGGYLIFDQITADHYFVTHGEIQQPGFSARDVLSRPPPEETPSAVVGLCPDLGAQQ
ncbi:hypothetical protein B0H14DRAFT_3730162 [Mycena olivaceomarginata]|nr:hypothetical protein B0H14DRAFT_3730162 [Mycena olivaceomarginata]